MNTKNSCRNNVPEISGAASEAHRSSISAGIASKGLRGVAAGRLGVCTILIVFISCYLYGITTYGVVLGVGLGWLPSAFMTWLAASVIGAALHRIR